MGNGGPEVGGQRSEVRGQRSEPIETGQRTISAPVRSASLTKPLRFLAKSLSSNWQTRKSEAMSKYVRT